MASVATMLMAITLFLGLRIGDVPALADRAKVARDAGDEALDRAFAEQAQNNKRRNFPVAVGGMLTILVIAGIGAASDWSVEYPVNVKRAALWATPHLIAACVGIGIMIVAFYFQALKLQQQGEHIARIMDEVARIRKERGLSE